MRLDLLGQEREPYLTQASRVNLAYEKALLEEVNGMPEVTEQTRVCVVFSSILISGSLLFIM